MRVSSSARNASTQFWKRVSVGLQWFWQFLQKTCWNSLRGISCFDCWKIWVGVLVIGFILRFAFSKSLFWMVVVFDAVIVV